MKKMTKILLAAGGAALICGGSVMTYLKAQTPMTIQEELTLANLEAMASKDLDKLDLEPGEHINYDNAANYYCSEPVGARGCGNRENSICTIGTFCNRY
ncbi:hypothetical protein [uncultured Rikenella sp.]|uniref:hypothetical protein n=4 Tax=uncultured Rikenella sp. TaxID=368003 RepID=UPI0026326E0B|nr:hypothetical protein [uncultured Rikenella sp.]